MGNLEGPGGRFNRYERLLSEFLPSCNEQIKRKDGQKHVAAHRNERVDWAGCSICVLPTKVEIGREHKAVWIPCTSSPAGTQHHHPYCWICNRAYATSPWHNELIISQQQHAWQYLRVFKERPSIFNTPSGSGTWRPAISVLENVPSLWQWKERGADHMAQGGIGKVSAEIFKCHPIKTRIFRGEVHCRSYNVIFHRIGS